MATRATPAIKKPEPAPKPPAAAPRPPAPAPVAATASRAAAGPPAVRLGAPAAKGGAAEGAVAPGVVELKGMSDFKPAAPVTEFLDANKTSTINARFGDLAQGPLEVKTSGKGKYRVKKQPLPLSHPAFAFVPQFVPGLTPALLVGVENNKLIGEVGLAAGPKVQRISSFIQKTPDMLGLAGFTIGTLPTIVNAIEGGSLHFGLKAVPIKLGSAFSGKFNFDVIDTNVSFDANAAVVVKGLANGTLDLKRAPSGLITGRAAIGLSLSKNFSGSVDVAWDGVAISGIGKVGYTGEKFSGEVTLQMMERNQALALAQSKQSPPADAAKAAAAKKPVKIDYVVFGEGDLNFSFTEWLSGTAHVIVDPKGNVTVIGKITPQKEFILFPQKDYIRPLFKFEARASYGIPVVGNIFIFANVGMDLFAKLGPAKFYNIVVDGTYSTDPTVAKNFTIRGSLNISAAAGARLRAEAGAGLEILSHDIKAGAGINGIAGIKAYAEATPVIGYREKAVEGQDMKGEWFVRGDLELAAQPFLGLSGDLFVEISTPWWSPLSDHRWTWPLFSKEWPLGSSMGMLVSVDYVFGSGQWPKFDLKPVEFDSNKFVTGLYEDSAKSGPGKELEQKGKWQEKNSAAAQPPPKGTQTGSAKPGKLDSGKAKTKQAKTKKLDKPVDPNARTKEGKSVKQLQDEAQKKGKGVKTKGLAKDGKGGTKETTEKKAAGPQKVVKEFSMKGKPHRLNIEMLPGGVDVHMASAEGALLTKVKDEIATQENIIKGLPPGDTELIDHHTRAKAALEAIVNWFEAERKRINGLRAKTPEAEVIKQLRNLGEQLASRIIKVAIDFRLDDFVRKAFNIAEHLNAISEQVYQLQDKHANNKNAIGDRMAYTAAAAEIYLGWVEPAGRRHSEKVSIGMAVIQRALKELDALVRNGVDLRGERMYVRGKTLLELCAQALKDPSGFIWARGAHVVKAFIDDMDQRGLKGNGGAVAAAKRRLGMT